MRIDIQIFKGVSLMAREFCVAMLVGLIAVMGCQKEAADPSPKAGTEKPVTSEDVRRDAGKTADSAAKLTQQSKEEFQEKLEARLKTLDGEIEKLREKGSDLKDEAKVDWERKMADLETKRETARTKLAEVRESSGEAWKDVQKGAEAAWDDLDKAFQDAAKEF